MLYIFQDDNGKIVTLLTEDSSEVDNEVVGLMRIYAKEHGLQFTKRNADASGHEEIVHHLLKLVLVDKS